MAESKESPRSVGAQARVDKLERRVERMHEDLQEVKTGVRSIQEALTGDGLRQGIIATMNSRMDTIERESTRRDDEHAKELAKIMESQREILDRTLSSVEIVDVRNVVSLFKGWRLVIAALIAATPLVVSILTYLSK